MIQKVEQKLKNKFSDKILDVVNHHNETTFIVKKNAIVEICEFLKEDPELSFDLLVDVCGLDRLQKNDRFEVVYNIYSIKNKTRIRIRVKVDEKDIHVPSITSVWGAANFYERETYDFYGIIFDNHPDLRRIYMPEDYEYFPLRKDFPLMGIPDSLPLPRR